MTSSRSLLNKRLGYSFKDVALQDEALRHRSYTKGSSRTQKLSSNERLEFLGDRVLGLVMAEWLFQSFKSEDEGKMGARHAQLVSGDTLAKIALEIDLASFLFVDPRESKTILKTPSVLVDAVEAHLGAIFLDSGIEEARDTIKRLWKNHFSTVGAPPKGNKSALQEYVLKLTKQLPKYNFLGSSGPDHAPLFKVEALACGHSALGEGASKKMAEDMAAESLLKILKKIKR